RGLAFLRQHGVTVDTGAGAPAVEESLAPYLHHRRTGRPFLILKTAASLDGRTAAADGTSQWITGPEARADGHRLRAESQAVLVGAGTALSDRPALTARDVDAAPPRQPVRVLVDATGRVPPDGPLFDPALAPTLVFTTAAAPGPARKAWLAAGADVEELSPGPDGTGVDLPGVLSVLGGRGVLQALVEGGATLAGSFLWAGLVDRLVVYVGGPLLGEHGLPMVAGTGPATLGEAPRWRIAAATALGGDVRLDCDPGQEG
ncbi:MAG: bifunctional diaminohydroxyphosphoribosylaminopyrimidine deaminase/5-amino-6-(5-phosphoribosylamino)uracil reductase RibD, partial [Acidimicrobiia bacterium]